MVAQYGFGGGVAHGGVDLDLLVLQADRFGGDTTCGKRHTEAGVRKERSKPSGDLASNRKLHVQFLFHLASFGWSGINERTRHLPDVRLGER